MRTAVISDIHIDINGEYDVIGALARRVQAAGAELLLIAGDISNNVDTTINAVAQLEQKSGIKVLYVPGNHDMWDMKKEYQNNDIIYEKYLADEHCLSGKSFETEKFYIIGDVGWYDYSYGNGKLYTEAEFDKMSINGRTFQDFLFNTWSHENKKRCRWFTDRLSEAADANPGKKLVIMTHVLSHEAFLVPEFIGDWSYLNACLGSNALKELCVSRHAAYAICGHVHYRRDVIESGVTWLCRCLNYHSEWRGAKDVDAQIEDAMEVIEL